MNLLLEAGDSRLEAEGKRLSVTGGVDFEGAAELAGAGSQWLSKQAASSLVVLDLSGVDRVSSAAISVMLEWLRQAQRQHLIVQAVVLSPPLRRLAEIAGIDSLLPTQTVDAQA